MNIVKKQKLLDFAPFDELLDAECGLPGTLVRDEFDREAYAFCLAETLKEERQPAGLTQEELAERIGTKKTYISRLENGKADIQLWAYCSVFSRDWAAKWP